MSWSDGQVEVRHYFHLDNANSYPVLPPSGAVVLFQWVDPRNWTESKIIPGTNPPVTVQVPIVEMHYLITMNPNLL